ncbi:hypothetical protein RSP673_006185 [Ralstonia solanacearum P673]|nr:hypothetical protein [Ralstonia solanacearum]MCL9866435.1 hypothetical protein [Ralstonia solanacearum]MCL9876009.1 hypothetical protein [Ralstonia solanacearum]
MPSNNLPLSSKPRAIRRQRGQLIQVGLPQSGWVLVGIRPSEEGRSVCQLCFATSPGPMRLFSHPDLRDDLQVDEGCAERLLKAASGAVSSRQAFDVHGREVKRQQWLTRPWRRDATGRAYLRADGYYVLSYTYEGAWRYEIRKINRSTREFCLVSDGYRSGMAARLAAFDAITELMRADAARLSEVA